MTKGKTEEKEEEEEEVYYYQVYRNIYNIYTVPKLYQVFYKTE